MTLSLANEVSAPDELTAALAALERGGAITATSLQIDDPNLSWEAWVGLGEVFRRVRSASKWWLGDWYIFGGKIFGEDRASAVESVTGLNPHTLATVVRTCMYVPKRQRRLELPFSHHTEVCRLMPEDQVRLLQISIDHDFTREQLRQAVKELRNGYAPVSEPSWEMAEGLQRQQNVESLAREIWRRAQPGLTYWTIESELMTRLGEALGEEERR